METFSTDDRQRSDGNSEWITDQGTQLQTVDMLRAAILLVFFRSHHSFDHQAFYYSDETMASLTKYLSMYP